MHYHKLNCHAERFCLLSSGHGYSQSMTVSVVSIELLRQIRCKQDGDTLIVTLWLRVSVSTNWKAWGWGGGVPCNETDLVYLGNYVKFTATSSDKARFVTIVFVNGILLALTFEVNRT